MTYRDLYTLGDLFEERLKRSKDDNTIANYSVDVIPDDCKVKIVLVKRVPIKSIKCTAVVKAKGNTDNVKKVTDDGHS
jgi:hypothetical protein